MKNELPFRRTDNNITTQMKYDLEAAHWQKAYGETKTYSVNHGGADAIGLVGGILTIIISMGVLICTFCYHILRSIVKRGNSA